MQGLKATVAQALLPAFAEAVVVVRDVVVAFKGFVSERMFARWRPQGTVIRGDSAGVLEQVRAAITCTFRR